MYICPVCGYDKLTEPPESFNICPSCGTEFENDDAFCTHAELRAAWMRNGARWWSPVDPRPTNWDGYKQVNGYSAANGVIPASPILNAIMFSSQTVTGGLNEQKPVSSQTRSFREMLGQVSDRIGTAQEAHQLQTAH